MVMKSKSEDCAPTTNVLSRTVLMTVPRCDARSCSNNLYCRLTELRHFCPGQQQESSDHDRLGTGAHQDHRVHRRGVGELACYRRAAAAQGGDLPRACRTGAVLARSATPTGNSVGASAQGGLKPGTWLAARVASARHTRECKMRRDTGSGAAQPTRKSEGKI